MDQQAHHLGLTPGMTLADARARHPDLTALPHDPAADAGALDALAAAMVRFTPMVATHPPDGLVLDIAGCAHLFGGEAALARQAMAEAGFTARPAFADHAAAAWALARFGDRQAIAREGVHALPVAALELPEDEASGLRRAGLRTLGDLAARPMAGLAARFGEQAIMRLRAMLGETRHPIAPRLPAAPIRARLRFAEPIARSEDVLEAIEELLAQAAGRMEARGLGGRRFVVVLERADGARQRLAVETGQPVRATAPVMRLFRERIDSLADPLDPGFGYDAIALAVPRTQPLAARQIVLVGDGVEEQETIAALIDRLATRLGPNSVLRLQPRDTHIPEATQRLVPATQSAPSAWPPGMDPTARPLCLFDPPQPIAAIASVPDGPPQRFRWRGHAHEVRLAEGPERIAPEWWRRLDGHRPQNAGLTRDYYRVEDGEGRRFWIFRHGLFGETPHPDWYVHGLFP